MPFVYLINTNKSKSMRDLLDMIEPKTVDHFINSSCSNLLVESRAALTEASIIDRINTVTKRVHDQFGDVQYAFLAKATMKALDMFGPKSQSANHQVAAALQNMGYPDFRVDFNHFTCY